jgi:hypothetical protein
MANKKENKKRNKKGHPFYSKKETKEGTHFTRTLLDAPGTE